MFRYMKKLFLFVYAAMCGLELIAALRTPEEAMQIAASLGTGTQVVRIPSRQPSEITLCYTAKQQNGQPAFYVFNRSEDEGFVLIAADDRAHTVLGYADKGQWDEQNMAPATRAWLEGYCQTISGATNRPQHAPVEDPSKASIRHNKQYTAISPICQTQWGQGTPYNLLCPTYHDTVCPSGCVATAAGQIMKVYAYPTRGTGSSSYKWRSDTGDSITLYANYNTTYNWANMLNYYTSTGGTSTQRNAVATLLYHCGVVSEMDYGPRGSGTSNNYMLRGMVEHFGYDPGVGALIKDCMREEDFIAGIASELQAGRPVMFSARTINNEGHAFIGDGMDTDGLVHINWGWYGYCDGYFRVSAMDPADQGTGGSLTNEAYTERVIVYTNIKPYAGGSYQYTFMCDSLGLYETASPRSQGWVALNTYRLINLGIKTLSGTSSAFAVYDANGNFISNCDYQWDYDDLYPGYYYYRTYIVGDVSNLEPGNYYVSPMIRIDGKYVPVQLKGYTRVMCPMRITQDSVYLSIPQAESDIQEPNSYTYSQLAAYYYPTNVWGKFYWRLQLATQDFYEDYADNDQMLLNIGIHTASPRSFAGSFISDTTLYYNCRFCTVHHGNINEYTTVEAQDCELTITYSSLNDVYTIDYHIRLNGQDYVGQANVSAPNTIAIYGEDYQTYAKYDEITVNNSHYTAISTTEALQIINAHAIGWTSNIPYLVEGQIESLANTPEQMVQYGNCRLYLNDGLNTIYAFNTKWLNNESYTTGNEIAVGGTGAVLGKLTYYNATTKEIERGYFYHYLAPGVEDEEYGLQTDAENADYSEEFRSYDTTTHSLNDSEYYIYIRAQEGNAVVSLYLFPTGGRSVLTAGTYPFSASVSPGTAWRGNSITADGYISGSYAGYKNQNGITIPIWFPTKGTVIVNDDNSITVNATNSYGRTIRYTLGATQDSGLTPLQADDTTDVQKIMHNGHIYILRNGVTYSITGQIIGE